MVREEVSCKLKRERHDQPTNQPTNVVSNTHECMGRYTREAREDDDDADDDADDALVNDDADERRVLRLEFRPTSRFWPGGVPFGFWLLALSAAGRAGCEPALVQVRLCIMHAVRRDTPHLAKLQASFPIKVQVKFTIELRGWMDGCWLPTSLPTAEHRQVRLVKEQHGSLHSTQPTVQGCTCQMPTVNGLISSPFTRFRLAAWPVGGTVYECRVTNRPTGPRETDSLSAFNSSKKTTG